MLVTNYGVKCPVLFCCILVNMVRKYTRRTERGKFTAADLQDAARKINEDKRSIRAVAKEAGVCHVTLNRYIKKHRNGIPSSIPSYNTESKQVFSEAQESELESYIKKAVDIYLGLSPKDVRVSAFQCAKKFNIKMPSTWEEKECAGSDWYRISKAWFPLTANSTTTTQKTKGLCGWAVILRTNRFVLAQNWSLSWSKLA